MNSNSVHAHAVVSFRLLLLGAFLGVSGSLLGACGSDSAGFAGGPRMSSGGDAPASGGATAGGGATASGGATAGGGATASGGATAGGGASAKGGTTASGGATASGGTVGTECRTFADCPMTNCFGCPPPACVNGRCAAVPASGGADGGSGTGGAAGRQTGGVSNAGGTSGGACASAMVGASCSVEGTTCGGPCTDPCSFCNLLACNSGKWKGVEAAPAPCFECGTTQKCMLRSTYCDVAHSGIGLPDTNTCKPMPAACKTAATCACVKPAVTNDRCTESTPGGLVVEHDSG